MGTGIDIRIVRRVNIAVQDDRDTAGLSMERIRAPEARSQKREPRIEKRAGGAAGL
jgi:hypothetical protein